MKYPIIGALALAFLCGTTPTQAQTVLPDPQPAPATPAPAILSVSLPSNARLRLSDTDLKTILADIHHLRLVVFETPNNYGNRSAQIKSSNSVLNYYSAAYLTREGGRRTLRADIDEVQMIGVSFPSGGFAMVLSGPGFGVVMRGDGYPNLEGIGPLVMGATLYGTKGVLGR